MEAGTIELVQSFFEPVKPKRFCPTLKVMKRMIAFYHNKDIHKLKLGCTFPNLANMCLHRCTDAKFNPFTEGDNDHWEKFRKDVFTGPSTVFTRKLAVNGRLIRKSKNICKSFVRVDAGQLHQYSNSICQTMPTGRCARWSPNSETGNFTF